MKKKVLGLILLVLALVIALASCGDSESGPRGEQGPQGVPGDDGKSAYELAVEDGFQGDVTAWLLSLVGEKGEIGASVSDITKTSTDGVVDTYTITFSNGSTETFSLTNGINGKDGNGIV